MPPNFLVGPARVPERVERMHGAGRIGETGKRGKRNSIMRVGGGDLFMLSGN